MILEPNEHFTESYEIDMSGIALVPDGDDLLVDDVEAHSPAAEAGVQGGDILVAIDDRPAVELGLDRIRTLFQQNDKEYLLTLRRNGKVVQVKLKLRRLI